MSKNKVVSGPNWRVMCNVDDDVAMLTTRVKVTPAQKYKINSAGFAKFLNQQGEVGFHNLLDLIEQYNEYEVDGRGWWAHINGCHIRLFKTNARGAMVKEFESLVSKATVKQALSLLDTNKNVYYKRALAIVKDLLNKDGAS